MIGNRVPTSVCRRLRDSLLAALWPTHRSIQLEVRFLHSLLSCIAGEVSNRCSSRLSGFRPSPGNLIPREVGRMSDYFRSAYSLSGRL